MKKIYNGRQVGRVNLTNATVKSKEINEGLQTNFNAFQKSIQFYTNKLVYYGKNECSQHMISFRELLFEDLMLSIY